MLIQKCTVLLFKTLFIRSVVIVSALFSFQMLCPEASFGLIQTAECQDTIEYKHKSSRSRYMELLFEEVKEKYILDSLANKDEVVGNGIAKGVREEIISRLDEYGYLDEIEWDSLTYKNKKRISADQEIEVFGWHPYWMGSAYKSYNFELLTIVSYFSYDLNPHTGGYRNYETINSWKQTELVDMAHQSNCKVLLTVSSHGKENHKAFFTAKPEIRQGTIDSLINLIEEKEADGIDMNFENLPAEHANDFIYFVQSLSDQLAAKNPAYLLTMTLPAIDYEKAYHINRLEKFVNYFIIMGYDFHGPFSDVTGPVAPLNSDLNINNLDLRQSVDTHLDNGAEPGMVLLGLPYYGAVWDVEDELSTFSKHMTFKDIENTYKGVADEFVIDTNTNSCYYIINAPPDSSVFATERYKLVWFDNAESLGRKYDWLIDKGLGGIGIWALGYDNGRNELWAVIDDKFTEVNIPPVNRVSHTIVRTVRKYSTVIIVVIIFLLGFLGLGLVFSLSDWKVREALFKSKISKIFFLAFFITIAFTALSFFNLFGDHWVALGTGIVVGLLITLFVSNVSLQRRSELP